MVVQANVVISADVINPTATDKDDTLMTMLRLFWDTEFLGILDGGSDENPPTFLE